MSVFRVFFVTVVGLLWVKFLLAGPRRHQDEEVCCFAGRRRQDEEVCCFAGGEGLYNSCYAG